MRTSRLVLLAVVGAVLALVFFACTIVDGLSLPDVDAGDGAADASEAGAGFDAGPCRRPGWPDPPPFNGGGSIQFRVAVTGMDFGTVQPDAGPGGDASPGPPAGYNLDKQCTCEKPDPASPPDPSSCVTSGSNMACDDIDGIDNATGRLVNGPARAAKLDVGSQVTRALASGHNGLLIQVSQYNGMPNDSDITLSFYESGGPVKLLADGGVSTDNVKPTFTTADLWSVDTASLLPTTSPDSYVAISTTPGWVTNNILVASNLNAALRVDANLSIQMRGAAITARISQENGAYFLRDAFVVGRWPTSDALRSLGQVVPPTDGGGYLCDDPVTFAYLKALICDSADISTNGPDNQMLKCDALSVGIHFEAAPATFGPVIAVPSVTAPCANPEAGIIECP
jgi:hypothetical protein